MLIGKSYNIVDICEFLDYTKKENYMATICAEKDAEFVVGGAIPLYFRFEEYSDAEIERIMAPAEQWRICCKTVEIWDPAMYSEGRVERESLQKIGTGRALVRDGDFAGVVDYSCDAGYHFELFCALISDYIDTPLHFASSGEFGSSDRDMIKKINYYLQKV